MRYAKLDLENRLRKLFARVEGYDPSKRCGGCAALRMTASRGVKVGALSHGLWALVARNHVELCHPGDLPHPRWVECSPGCGGLLCTVHDALHVEDCACPPVDQMDYDPRVRGASQAFPGAECRGRRSVPHGASPTAW